MKAFGFVILVLLLMLSGCTAQTNNPTEGQPMPIQTASAAPADASEEEPQKTGAAGTTEETETAEETNDDAEAVEETAADAAGAVAAGAAVLKNGIGVFGMIVVLAVCTVPILKIGFAYLTYKGAAGLSGTVADSSISKLLGTIGTAFGMVLGLVGSAAVMLFVSVIISMKAVT